MNVFQLAEIGEGHAGLEFGDAGGGELAVLRVLGVFQDVGGHQLAAFGAVPTDERVVHQGKIVTAAGVSSGIDMALTLVSLFAGPEMAQAVQLGIEYDPQPPFNSGSVHTADPAIVDLVRSVLESNRETAPTP